MWAFLSPNRLPHHNIFALDTDRVIIEAPPAAIVHIIYEAVVVTGLSRSIMN